MGRPNRRKPNSKKKEDITDIEVARKMINIAQSASDRKLEYDLTFNTVKGLMTEDVCWYTGKIFQDEGIYSRSFDRIDSFKGYIEGNVVACTVDFNGKKSNLTLEEIEILYNKLVKPSKKNAKVGPKKNIESSQETVSNNSEVIKIDETSSED